MPQNPCMRYWGLQWASSKSGSEDNSNIQVTNFENLRSHFGRSSSSDVLYGCLVIFNLSEWYELVSLFGPWSVDNKSMIWFFRIFLRECCHALPCFSYCLVTRFSQHNPIITSVCVVPMSFCLVLQSNNLICSALIFAGRYTRYDYWH